MNAVSPAVTVERLDRAKLDAFRTIHSGDYGWCNCTAWWVPTWDGWSSRTQQENAALRQQLFDAQTYDGYLIFKNGELAGWCQAWKRDDFAKILQQFELGKDANAWMIGCLLIRPEARRQGVASAALAAIVADLKARGARSIDAFPKRNFSDEGELWNGPESTYLQLGFKVVRDDVKRPLLRIEL